MTSDELQLLRERKWADRVPPELTPASFGIFVEEAGLVPLAPIPGVPLPSLELLIAGSRDPERSRADLLRLLEESVANPAQRQTTAPDGTARDQSQIRSRALASGDSPPELFELDCWPMRLYCTGELLPYIYAEIGDRLPETDFRRDFATGRLTQLAAEIYELLLQHPAPMSRSALQQALGRDRVSALAVDRGVLQLTASLRVLRVGREGVEPLWQAVTHAQPAMRHSADRISKLEAAGALISRFLFNALLESEEKIAEFFHPLFATSRTHSALLGLEAAHEVILDSLDGRPAFRLAHLELAEEIEPGQIPA
jgi:hypothetical protein